MFGVSCLEAAFFTDGILPNRLRKTDFLADCPNPFSESAHTFFKTLNLPYWYYWQIPSSLDYVYHTSA
jgi:hypothetical protein